MNTSGEELVAFDQFVSAVYWADDDISVGEALVEAIDDWVATASAEHHGSEPFTTDHHDDPLASSLSDLVVAVDRLTADARPGLTVARALGEALEDWCGAEQQPTAPRVS